MITLYNTAVDALVGIVAQMAKKMPVTGENLQQALMDVEVALDRAETEQSAPSTIATLLNLHQQLVTAEKYTYYAQPCQP